MSDLPGQILGELAGQHVNCASLPQYRHRRVDIGPACPQRAGRQGVHVEAWGARLYGDPCRECRFDWSITPSAAASLVAAIPARYASLLDGQDAARRYPGLDWTAGAYVCHVTDNLRVWAERLAGAALGGS